MPFTAEQFFEVFARYNETVYPAQIVLVLLAVAAVAAARGASLSGDRVAAAILGSLWLWMGLVYHLAFFTAVNPAAYLFAAVFALEGFLFFALGLGRQPLRFRFAADARGIAGAALILFALVVYPFIGHLSGRVIPLNPTFGLPCPTVIFTCGLLLWSRAGAARWLSIAPLFWTIVGGSAAVFFGIREDSALWAAGLTVAALAAEGLIRPKEIL